MEKSAKIFIAGHKGLVGSALVRRLQALGYANLVLRDRRQVNLIDQAQVNAFFAAEKPEYVIHAAGLVGGIMANSTRQADFLYENMMVAANVIRAAAERGTRKLLFLGSSCIYPKFAKQPIHESELLASGLEPTNEGYAVAKIAGLKLCTMYRRQYGKDFISAMPTNLYGPNDNFDLVSSHVLPALLRKFHDAKISGKNEVILWGTGKPLREFLHVDDLADALLTLMEKYGDEQTINVGSGEEVSIAELARIVAEVTEFQGDLVFDSSKPDGTPRKILDSGRLRNLGWEPRISLVEGVRNTYQWALKNSAFT
ncbi:MAG: GDP-L-fucose synthase [Bdellovibrionales bacterium]|nr:GDP-L-fucose synthase [Bdellovibrionales bacterium]